MTWKDDEAVITKKPDKKKYIKSNKKKFPLPYRFIEVILFSWLNIFSFLFCFFNFHMVIAHLDSPTEASKRLSQWERGDVTVKSHELLRPKRGIIETKSVGTR